MGTYCEYCGNHHSVLELNQQVDALTAQLAEWYKVFGHLSKDADTAGNMINEGIAEMDEAVRVLSENIQRLEKDERYYREQNAALRAEAASRKALCPLCRINPPFGDFVVCLECVKSMDSTFKNTMDIRKQAAQECIKLVKRQAPPLIAHSITAAIVAEFGLAKEDVR